MPFSSLHFLFLFLPVFLLLYFVIPVRWWRNLLLLGGSLFFYAWANPIYLILLIASILFNWLLARWIGSLHEKQKGGWAKVVMLVAVIANLLVLTFYKYSGFLVDNINALFHANIVLRELPLPLGISFFTFSAVSYIVDVYRTDVKAERNLIHLANYLAMFPKMAQGPITRYGQVETTLKERKVPVGDIADGIRRFIVGLSKKVLIADNVAIVANAVFGKNPSSIGADMAWYGVIAYALQIYFDFSGYTDMAIGLGKILGFRFPENFNYPYISRSISDFWRRWHMSLTSFFRDYVFMPLEIARKKEKFIRQQTNLVIVFLLTGLWHGASWNFVIWGIYFGVILAIEAIGLGKWLKKIPVFFQHLYSIILILMGWIFFRIENIAKWGPFFKALFGGNGWTGQYTLKGLNIFLFWPLMALAIFLSTPILAHKWEMLRNNKIAYVITDVLFLALFVLSVSFLVANGYEAFLYAQF